MGEVKKLRRNITVVHPAYGSTTVLATRDKLDAVTEAARRWGAQWSAIAREAEFLEEGACAANGQAAGDV